MSAPADQPRPASNSSDQPQHASSSSRGDGPSLLRLAAVLQAEQRSSWLRGQRIPVETWFADHPVLAADAEAALDVIYAEYALRQELGEAPDTEDYFRRFPQFRAALERQFQLDRALLSTDEEPDEESPQPPTSAPALLTIGRYPIVALLEQGGQATVYRAIHPTLQRDVVIKLGRPTALASPHQRERLQREGQILAALDHPNLARVYDLDFHAGRVFLVLEYIRGQNLGQCASSLSLSPLQASQLVARVASAVAVAHRHGILHLDINPNNILVDEAGEPRLIDFGLASWCRDLGQTDEPARIIGTPEFMAPEQARGETRLLGAGTDVFALGGLLYYLLTGRPPFMGGQREEVLTRARGCAVDHSALVRADIPSALRRICQRALTPTPEERYRRVDDLAVALKAFAQPPRWPRRLARLSVLMLLLLTATLAAWLAGWPRFTRDPVASTATTTPVTPPVERTDPVARPGSLGVRVWTTSDHSTSLRGSLPLRTGDRLQITVDAPANLYVSLFLISSAGQMQRLAERDPGNLPSPLLYPPNKDEAVPLSKPHGNEVLLACGRTERPIEVSDLRPLWDPMPLPVLPDNVLVWLHPDEVKVEHFGRDFGKPVPVPKTEATVSQHLEALRKGLRGIDFVEGVAFSHWE
jgi:serine/threonine protein kinase